MTETQFRRLALALQGVSEGAHMGHPDFRAHGRIFATLHAGGAAAMVALTPEQQARFIDASAPFAPESGAWGRDGYTRVALAKADEEQVGEALTLAWRNAAAKSRRATRSGKAGYQTVRKHRKASTRKAAR
jgi:hypothetical protein